MKKETEDLRSNRIKIKRWSVASGMSKRAKQILIKALKIGMGSCIAILLAHFFGLKNEISAGTIALLTILNTRWETFRLAYTRIISFFVTVLICYAIANHLGGGWIEYGVAIFLIVIFCELLGWMSTLSINAVIGAHFFTSMDFSPAFIWNEFCLLLFGISIAVVLSLFTNNRGSKKMLVGYMHYVEQQIQVIMGELAAYLLNQKLDHSVWDDVVKLEEQIKEFIEEACRYRDNAIGKRPEHYIGYFEMRLQHITMLHSLHYEMRRIRSMPVQGKIIADLMLYMKERVKAVHTLEEQIARLKGIAEQMKDEPLPVNRDEFESRAILYHILMELEDYLMIKKRFIDGLGEKEYEETFLR